jgi:hypothetical protein
MRSTSEIIAKQQARAVAGVDLYKQNVQSPEKDPVDAALAANGKRIANLQASIKAGTWENAMKSLPKGIVGQKAATLGADRYVAGVQGNIDKLQRHWAKFGPLLASAQATINAMPQDTPEQRDAKSAAMIKAMRALKGKGR